MLERLSLTPTEANRAQLDVKQDGRRRSAFDLLAHPTIDFARLCPIWPELAQVDARIASQLEVDARYASYVDRQTMDVAALRKDEGVKIPSGVVFTDIVGLSNELRHKLGQHRPTTLAQAGRIDGMTPAALMLVLAHIKKGARSPALQAG
jgi:tRNA uridine 5-carboxymethylaminomethyl modification enzyme